MRQAWKDLWDEKGTTGAMYHLRQHGLCGLTEYHAMQIIDAKNPEQFLLNDSPFHTLAGVEVEKIRRIGLPGLYEGLLQANKRVKQPK
ncbi:MAG: hypothetical protein ACO38N_12030 [Candidatus Nanopelagicales bacterium]